MPALICGSLAFDTITTFPGRFAHQILPEQLHILNVSFLVPTLRREFGGCAGNIAYTLQRSAASRWCMAALGNDGADYLERLRALGRRRPSSCAPSPTATPRRRSSSPTSTTTRSPPSTRARCSQAHEIERAARATTCASAIIAPDGRDAMLQHAAQLAAAGIPFIFDPGQGLPMFDGDELRRFIEQATWVAVNDYEAQMLSRAHRPDARGAVALAPARRRRHARRRGLRGLAATASARMCRASRPTRWSTRPAAATPFAPRCSTGSSAAGRWSAAPSSATGSAR